MKKYFLLLFALLSLFSKGFNLFARGDLFQPYAMNRICYVLFFLIINSFKKIQS